MSEVVQFTNLVANDHAEIPQRVEKAAKEPLFVRADPATEQHQQIDVRLETQVTTAVPAECDDGNGLLRCADLRVELPQDRVDTIGMPLESGAPSCAAQGLGFELGSCGVEGRDECRSAGTRLCQ